MSFFKRLPTSIMTGKITPSSKMKAMIVSEAPLQADIDGWINYVDVPNESVGNGYPQGGVNVSFTMSDSGDSFTVAPFTYPAVTVDGAAIIFYFFNETGSSPLVFVKPVAITANNADLTINTTGNVLFQELVTP